MKSNGLKSPAYASLTLAFASFGDAFLYPFLPMNYAQAGVSVVWVGVLLSVNRFVRILSNGFIVHLFAKYGMRLVIIIATSIAILSTAGYSIASGPAVWIVLRVAWGLSFSAMRIGTLGYALQHHKHGLALGISRSLQETGPMIALLLAPLLLRQFNSSIIFIFLSISSFPALYFGWKLPCDEKKTPPPSSRLLLKFPSSFNSLTLVSAILIDGILVVVLGVLFLKFNSNITWLIATTMAAFYLGYRRLCLVVLSPVGGWIADKIGIQRTFNISIAFIVAGLFLTAFGWVAIGVVIVFTSYSVNAAIAPGTAFLGERDTMSAVAENATWRDIGSAFGTLIGGFLITSAYLSHVLLFAIFGLLILLLIHLGSAQKALKFLYLWK